MTPPPVKEARCRREMIFVLDEATSVFTEHSYSIIAKKKELKTFLIRLAEEQPESMRPLLRKIREAMPSSTRDSEDISGGKRSAQHKESNRKAKKAKLERTKAFAEQNFDCGSGEEDTLFVTDDEDEQHGGCDGAGDRGTIYTPYETEFGLTHGKSEIHSMFTTKFATIPHSDRQDGSRILEICKDLKFEQVLALLIQFFRTPTKTATIPLSCDVDDASEVLRILRKIDRFDQEPKTHKAFAQMRLFKIIEATAHKDGSDYHKVIDKLAQNDVGSHVSKEFAEKVKEYHIDYHKGRKWLQLSESFGGTGIVFIIIIVSGTWKITDKFTDFERNCLDIVGAHLLSVRKIVDCLGAGALEHYCRHGCLAEQKIEELESLEGLAPDENDDNGEQDMEDDRQ